MSKNNNITVDEEFRGLLPPLPGEVYEELEKSIRTEGCRDAVVLWNGVIVDGHNRYEICQKHRTAFQRVHKDFDSRDEAKIWIISTQLARRQLTGEELVYFRGMQFNLEKDLRGGNHGNQYTVAKVQNAPLPKESGDTAQRLANQYNVDRATIKRDGQVAKAIDKIGDVSSDAKQKILKGQSNITKKELGKLHKASDEEISEAAGRIADGTYTKKEKAAKTSAADTKKEAKTSVLPAEPIKDESSEEPAPEQPDEPADKPETAPEPSLHIPEGWEMPETIQGKKQTWCAYISAGIDALGGVIGNIEKDLKNKLPLVESQAERDFLRSIFQSYIDKQLEIIKQI
jgi:hypothetical protein